MRKSYDGLAALASSVLGENPASGQLFVFINRRRTQMKILYFDRGGYCIWSKRLEQGQFHFARGDSNKRALHWRDLQLIIDGIDTASIRRFKRYSDRKENDELKSQLAALQQPLDWFKKQIFGQTCEKRLIDNPRQASLFGEAAAASAEQPDTEQVTYTRHKGKSRSEDCATDQGLRFDADVPVERIALPPAGLNEANQAQYEVIGEKITRRLAQRPGSYVVLEYVRPVVKHKPTGQLHNTPAPTAVFDNCIADVSVLAGLLVDKFIYHLPLYRQHRRLKDAGITLSRSTLTYWVQRSITLLKPIHDAQLEHILQSKTLSMDEKFAGSEFSRQPRRGESQGWDEQTP